MGFLHACVLLPLTLLSLPIPSSPPTPAQPPPGMLFGLPFPRMDRAAAINVLWVETNGAAFGIYDSTQRYHTLTAAAAAHPAVNLTIMNSGTITLGMLNAYDIVIVPSLANYNFAWTSAEVTAFVDYAAGGGCLYIWTDNPNTNHAAVDPILAQVGLSRTGSLLPNDIWDVTLPGYAGNQMWGLVGGSVSGGTPWLKDGSVTAGTSITFGAGEVWLLGDCNVYAEQVKRLDNATMLAAVAILCS